MDVPERGDVKSRDDFNQDWATVSDDILGGVYEWRLQHPKAPLTELEAAIDERLDRLRTMMLRSPPRLPIGTMPRPTSAHASRTVARRFNRAGSTHARSNLMAAVTFA